MYHFVFKCITFMIIHVINISTHTVKYFKIKKYTCTLPSNLDLSVVDKSPYLLTFFLKMCGNGVLTLHGVFVTVPAL